jgi:hypothetical protein
MTRFWINLHQTRYAENLKNWKAKSSKVLGAIKPNSLNRIAKIYFTIKNRIKSPV